MSLEGLLIGSVALLSAASAMRPRKKRRRGRRLVERPRAKRIRPSQVGDGVPWGGVELPRNSETSHFLVVGTTGSGKTLTIKSLMARALPRIEVGSDTRALVYDAKQDMLPLLRAWDLGCEVVSLNPFDEGAAAWDIARDVTTPASALQVASAFIPEDRGSNRFFSDAARDLLAGVMLSFIECSPGAWTLGDVVYALRSKSRTRSVLERTELGEELVENYFAEERTCSNIIATVRSRLAPLEPVAAMWSHAERSKSLHEWVAGGSILVLGSNEAVRTSLDAINRVIFKRLVELVLASPESRERRSWFFLDEIREAGKLEGLSSLLTRGRSKGAAVVLGFQDVSGMKEAHGEHAANELMGMCSHKALLRMESGETAAWAARLVGEYECIEELESYSAGWGGRAGRSRSRSEHRVRADAVLPSEFLSLPPAGPANGVPGFFLSPEGGAHLARVPLEALTKGLPSREQAARVVPGVECAQSQHLRPWGASDRARLGLVSPMDGAVLSHPLREKETRRDLPGHGTISRGRCIRGHGAWVHPY